MNNVKADSWSEVLSDTISTMVGVVLPVAVILVLYSIIFA